MIKVSKSTILHFFIRLLSFVAIAKIISLTALWYLPSDGVELSEKTNKQTKYRRIDFANMIKVKKVKKATSQEAKKKNNVSITNMLLKGFYGSGPSGYAILALKKSPKKTSIIEVGEDFSSYKLKLIKARGVIFTKAGKEYVLNLGELKKSSSITKAKARPKKLKSTQTSQKSTTVEGITRKDIAFYSKNPKQMWKDIRIVDHKVNGKLVGFKVKRIDKKSKFATLGLQEKDIIIKANNVVLKSYKDVFNIYNNIDKISTVQLVVLRNNEEKEFVYEID